MRKIYRETKYIRHSLRVSRKALKRRLRKKLKEKVFHRSIQGKPLSEVRNLKGRLSSFEITAPIKFEFLEHPEESTKFINLLESILKANRRVFVDMSKVEVIDHGAIASLLSVMFKFKSRKIDFNGNFPLNPEAARVVRESGFIFHLFENNSNKTKYTIGATNQMLTQVDEKLDPGLVDIVVQDSSISVWNSPQSCKGLYRVIIELIDNTREHAPYKKRERGSERWWLCINHDKANKKVSFVFLDYGIGIFASLADKPADHPISRLAKGWAQSFGMSASGEHLKSLVTTKLYETSSSKEGRGLGIYGIGQTMGRNQISNLHIISNNAYGNVDKKQYRRLNTGFNGTLFYWELCYNNEHQK